MATPPKEGNLEAPTRHALDWKNPEFYDRDKLNTELERVFDICHGCRRCVSLCESFPTLFDLIDESETLEVTVSPRMTISRSLISAICAICVTSPSARTCRHTASTWIFRI